MTPPIKPSVLDEAPLTLAKHVARRLGAMAASGHDTVEAAARAVVLAERSGHACVPLEELRSAGIDTARLVASGIVGQAPDIGNPASGILPLILDLDRLYLHRLHDYESRLASRLNAWLTQTDLAIEESVLAEVLEQAGLKSDAGEIDRQARAVEAGCRRPFTIISGGPGTGKTRTAAVLLHALGRLTPGLRIALAAPTGKAAARLQESIEQTRQGLLQNAPAPSPAPTGEESQGEETIGSTAEVLPHPSATTLHRLLGASSDGRRFRHGSENPLPHDLVLVDEASMVDLAMMCRLVTALKPGARLILLGDKDQLASVDAGYVLGDICEAVGVNSNGPTISTAVELQRNFRFGADSAIGRIAALVRAGEAPPVLAALNELDGKADVVWKTPRSDRELEPLLGDLFDQRLQSRFQATSAETAVQAAARLQILCAVRRGAFGVEGINHAIEARLEHSGLRRPGQTWYPGRQILVAANDPQQGLFNGDLGVVWPDDKGQLKVWFGSGTELRAFSPAQLPPHGTAFAITVHKSQGSEFDEVLVVLPPGDSPVCTRELVYTGLTRAKLKTELWATETGLTQAVERRVRRASGLGDRLRTAIR
jgi:exodeoxyribonuclease V alpha subunit